MSLNTTSSPQMEKLSTGRVISYALGDVANNLAFMMTSMFLMIYMTNIAGISAGIAGAIYGITKIWAGVADLVAGNTVDKANTRWGRLRPWIVFGSFPLIAMLVGLFSNPFNLSGMQIVVWIFLFDAAFQLAYSFVNIPYGSLSAAMTQDPVDRSRLAGARSIASALTSVGLAIIIAPQFRDPTTPADELATKFAITTVLLGVVAIVLYYICFKNTREVVPRAPGKMKLATTLKMVFKNPPLLTLCLGALFLLGAMFTFMAVTMYYVIVILGDATQFIYLQIAQTVGTVIVASFVPLITVKLGKRFGYVAMAAFAVVGYVVIAMLPTGDMALIIALVAWLLLGIGTGGTNALMFSMQADTVDYGEWKTGVRAEGGSYSILSFVRKAGQGVGGWVGGAVVAAFGYSVANMERMGDDPALADRIETGIRLAAGWIPAGLAVVAALVIVFYPLSAAKHRSLIADLTERRARRIAEEEGLASGDAISLSKDGGIVASRPVVTFNEQYGAGAAYVAERVADRLSVPYLSSKFSSEEIEDIDRASEADSSSNRLVWDMAHASAGVGADADSAAAGDAEARTALVRENTRELLGQVKGSGGAIVGRDATVVLAGIEGAFHVRLEAPVGTRIQRAAEAAGISQEVAARRQAREDQLRTEMSMRLMRWTPSNREHYDLVIDTGQTSLDDAVDKIVEGYRAKYPNI